MKFRFARMTFIIVIIVIIIYTIYIIYKNNNKKEDKSSQQTEIAVQYAKDIKLGISNFDTMNPLVTNNKDVININKLIFEPLFYLDENYELKPCLATEFAKTSATTYIVKINTGIQWSDGTNISASDVVYTVENFKKVNSIYSQNVQNIVATEEIDSSTIKIEINQETNFFEYNLIFPIVSKKYYGDEDYFASTKIPIGTGMIKISSINQNSIILVKNDNWRNPNNEEAFCEDIYIYLYSSMGEVYNSFKIGNIDFINTSSLNFADYVGTIGYYTKDYKGRNLDFLSLNCNDTILSEQAVRKAISFAIDKENIISSVYNNKYYASEYPIDFGTFVYSSNSASSGYNPEQAKSVLESAGWVYTNNKWRKDGNILSINLGVNATDVQRCAVADLIKIQLEQIGISVYVRKISDSQYISYLQNKNYQMLLTGVTNGFSPDASYFYSNSNIANYNNEEVFGILEDLKNITDRNLLIEKYKRLIEITKEEMPYICLYRNKNTVLVKQNAGGQLTPNNYNIYYNFWSWHRE